MKSTRSPTQRLKLFWCGILRKQVTVSFPFVRIKQPSRRLTLAALRQGQKITAGSAETGASRRRFKSNWLDNCRGVLAAARRLFYLRESLPGYTHTHTNTHIDKYGAQSLQLCHTRDESHVRFSVRYNMYSLVMEWCYLIWKNEG